MNHQIVRDPLHLFDANIFHPERDTLAFSEHLLVPAVMGGPLLGLGASPVLAYNILLLAGLALTGWGMYLAIARWTGDWVAGAVAGSLAAFNAHTLTRLPHLQALHLEFLPLALVALDRLISTPRVRHAVALAICFALQALVSNYLLVFTALALVVSFVVRADEWTDRRARHLVPLLTLAALLALLMVGPFLVPYARVRVTQGLVRPLDEVALYSASWRDYLTTPARLHLALWGARGWNGTTALFPGITAVVLAGVAAIGGVALRDRRARMCLAFAVAGLLLSFGPGFIGYELLYRVVPLLQGLRAAARFGHLTLIGIAALAGFGLARLRRTAPLPQARVALSLAAVALVQLEALRAPIPYTTAAPIPAVYEPIRRDPQAVVAEFPFYSPDGVFLNATYLLNSTRHWKPLLNGYSGFTPASYERHYRDLRTFPAESALAALRAAGVTYVVVHIDRFVDLRGAAAFEAVQRSPALVSVAASSGVRVYRVKRDAGQQ